MQITVFSQALMMEAVSAFETPCNFYDITMRSIPEYNHLITPRRENLKSH
jgi:hypothetical protein